MENQYRDKLRYAEHRSIKIKLTDIVLFLLTFGVYALNRTSSVMNKEYGWLAIIGLTIVISIFHILKNGKVYFGIYSIFQIGFLMIAFLSRYWAISPEIATAGFNSLLLTTVIILCTINVIDNKESCISFIRALAWAGVFMIIYLGFKNGFLNIINIRTATQNSIITDVNANDLGMKCVISALCSYTYGLYNKKNSNTYNALAVLLTIFSIFTGSRKVVIMLCFCFSILYVLAKKKNKALRFIVIGMVGIVSFYLIMTIPILYDAIGKRIQETFTLFDKNILDPYSSTGIRFRMMNLGIELFKYKPIIGYGLANAEVYNYGTYLHNNYLELLVGVGLVGTIAYYINPLIAILRNWKLFKYNQDKISLFFSTIVICLLLLDFSFVSYNSRAFQIVIAVASRYYVLVKADIKKKM